MGITSGKTPVITKNPRKGCLIVHKRNCYPWCSRCCAKCAVMAHGEEEGCAIKSRNMAPKEPGSAKVMN